MTECYVLMLAQGQYEDYTQSPVGVYLDHDKAKGEAERRNKLPSFEEYIEKKWEEEKDTFYLKYEFPTLPKNPYEGLKPVYDKSRERDKDYNLEYLKDKRLYQNMVFEWIDKVNEIKDEIKTLRCKAYQDWYKTLTQSEIDENCKGNNHPHYYVEKAPMYD